MNCFWGETIISIEDELPFKKGLIIPIVLLAATTIGLGVGSEAIAAYVIDAAHTLMNPDVYIDAVLE